MSLCRSSHPGHLPRVTVIRLLSRQMAEHDERYPTRQHDLGFCRGYLCYFWIGLGAPDTSEHLDLASRFGRLGLLDYRNGFAF